MNPIIERIKKLLRLGKDNAATPAEAAAALAKALQLAAENGLNLEDIPADSDSGILSHETIKSQAGPAHKLASGIVRRHFGVATLFDSSAAGHTIHFIGLPDQTALASYVYQYLVRTMRSAWRTRANKRLRDRDSFLSGFASAINSLMPAAFHRPGLILCAETYIKEVIIGDSRAKISTLKGPQAKSDKAFSHGHRAGLKAGIRNAIHGTETFKLES
jgi:Protein of unknown function (DUF2786)